MEILQWAMLLGIPAATIIVVVVIRQRARQEVLQLVAAALASNQKLDPEVLRVLVGEQRPKPEKDLRRGAVLVGIGIGLALIGFCIGAGMWIASMDGGSIIALGFVGFGALPLCIGATFILLAKSALR